LFSPLIHRHHGRSLWQRRRRNESRNRLIS